MGTKAEMVRAILANNKGKKIDDLVEPVMKKTGLSKSLARVYLKNNSQPKTAKKVAKKAAAKTTSSKKTDATK